LATTAEFPENLDYQILNLPIDRCAAQIRKRFGAPDPVTEARMVRPFRAALRPRLKPGRGPGGITARGAKRRLSSFATLPRHAPRSSCCLHPCPCGFYGDTTRECRCTPAIIQRYLGKISGPLFDRIDIHVEVPAVPYKELRGNAAAESSAGIRARVETARAVQQARGYYNSRMPSPHIRKQCALDDSGERTLEMAVRRMGLSARAHDRILKVARTLADLDGSAGVSAKHVAEAVQYRSLDRNYWT
jgi:hypothetical protein